MCCWKALYIRAIHKYAGKSYFTEDPLICLITAAMKSPFGEDIWLWWTSFLQRKSVEVLLSVESSSSQIQSISKLSTKARFVNIFRQFIKFKCKSISCVLQFFWVGDAPKGGPKKLHEIFFKKICQEGEYSPIVVASLMMCDCYILKPENKKNLARICHHSVWFQKTHVGISWGKAIFKGNRSCHGQNVKSLVNVDLVLYCLDVVFTQDMKVMTF